MIRLVFILFSLLILDTNACEIKLAPHIIKLNKVLSDEVISTSNCNLKTNKKLLELINNSNGTINTQRINSLLGSDENISLSPNKITITPIRELLDQKFGSESLVVKNVTTMHKTGFLAMTAKPNTNFICKTCIKAGTHNVRAEIGPEKIWININLYKRVLAYKSLNTIGHMTPILTPKDFIKSVFLTQSHSSYFTDIKNIHFYKATRNISAGELLKANDLLPKNLINRGQKVQIIVKNKTINLNSVGKAMRSGKFGDFIEIQNPKSKKTTLAKVIDFNKVLVEL